MAEWSNFPSLFAFLELFTVNGFLLKLPINLCLYKKSYMSKSIYVYNNPFISKTRVTYVFYSTIAHLSFIIYF